MNAIDYWHTSFYYTNIVYGVQETGQWNGLVKSIMDKEADMVMTSLKITPERNQMIDFSVPFLETGITILVAVRDGVISPTAFLGKAYNHRRFYFNIGR